MASCDNPEHAALESELNDALEEALQMEERLAAYEAAGAGAGGDLGVGGGGAAARALEEIATLTEQAATLEKERDAYEQDYLNQKDRVDNLETQLEDKDLKAKELDKLRRKLEEDLENTRKLLQTEKTKAADAQKRAGGADKTRRTEQRDQIRVLQELQDLRERAEDLEAQVKERDVLVEELVLSNQAQLERNETLTVQNEDLRGEFNEATQLLEEKRRELLDCHDQLEVAREAEEEYERRLDEEEAKGRRRVHALEVELRAEKTVVAQLREEAVRAKERAGAGGQRERELDQLRAEVERLGRELLKQSTAFEQAGLDLEVLTQELELERRKNRELPHEIRLAEAHKAEALEAKVKALTSELDTEKRRYVELEERKDLLEEQLQEVEDWKQTYEEGHGLVDAVQFQKKLKNDLHRLETELEQRSLKMGEVMDANEVLTLTCQRLKDEAGRPQDFSYGDLAAAKQAQAGEVARMTAVASELQAQVDDLNDERVRLLKKLRDGAASGAVAAVASGGDNPGKGDEEQPRSQASQGGSDEAHLAEAVKRLAVEGGEDAMFAQTDGGREGEANGQAAVNAGDPGAGPSATTAPGGAPKPPVAAPLCSAFASTGAAATAAAASAAGATPVEAGDGGQKAGGALSTREEVEQLARENRSLREALMAMATKQRGTDDSSATSGGEGGSGDTGTCSNNADSNGNSNGNGNDRDASAPGKGAAAEREEADKLEQQEAADKRVEQLTRVNETIMRQLQALMARKDSPREAARRAGRAAGGGGGVAAGAGKDDDKSKPAAAVQADMQRLIAEMGDLRQLVAGGFANNKAATRDPKNPEAAAATLPSSPPANASGGTAAGGSGGAATGLKAREGEEAGTGGGAPLAAVSAPADGSAAAFSDKPQQQQQQQQHERGPKTAKGQEALRWHLRRLNLPPEEWAEDVRDVNAQLVEALEQLHAREVELDEHEELIARYETHLSDMRAQAAALYREHANREVELEDKQKASREEAEGLREERDALAIRARRLEEVLQVEDEAAEDPTAPHRALRELSRKVTVFEVNEAVMARRYASVKEQLQMESEARAASERDFAEMSTAGKTRVLYLEQWKAGASARLLRLQQRLDVSVPEQDLVCARRELEQLQGEFLALLQSSAESRVQVARLSGLSETVRQLEQDLASARTELAASEEGLKQATFRLEKADARAEAAASEASAQVAAIAGGATQADFAGLLAEVAKHQGDCAKAQVDRAAATRRAEMAERRLATLDTECQAVKERAASLEARERDARQSAHAAAAELIEMKNRFEGGLSREQARALEERLEKELLRAEALSLEADRHKEIADIASEQTLAMNHQRKDAEEELSELRKAVSDLESRSDDDRLIGQLQRRLTATKVAYRSFARKHEMTKANLRRKTALLRVLELRLDKREDTLHDLHERSQEKVAALKGALVDVAEGRSGSDVTYDVTGPDGAAGPTRGLTITRAREIAARLSELTAALEASEASLRAAERSRRSAEMDAEAAEESRRDLETLVADLKRLILPTNKAAPSTAAAAAAADGDGDHESSGTPQSASTDHNATGGNRSRVNGGGGGGRKNTGASPTSLSFSSSANTTTTSSNHGDDYNNSDGTSNDHRYADGAYASAAVETAARRLLSLSEELRAAKLEASGLRRHVSGLREDRRHLERKLCAAESAARALEEAKAEAETRALLLADGGGGGGGAGGGTLDSGGRNEDTAGLDAGDGGGGSGRSGPGGRTAGGAGGAAGAGAGVGGVGFSEQEQRMLVAAYAMPAGAEADFGGLDPEETLNRLRDAHAKATSLARALEDVKAERDGAMARVDEASRAKADLQRALRFYEQQAAQNGLSRLDNGSDGNGPPVASSFDGGGSGVWGGGEVRRRRSLEVERERAGMQEAASATVASMKRLLEEKNAAMERMKRKLDEARAAGRGAATADRTEAARLTDRIYRENEDSLGQLRVALRQLGAAGGLSGEGTAMNSRLIGQLEEVSGLLGEKDETIRQLELKLSTACNQRERAEARCGEALEENAKMRSDLAVLAAQVQDAEERSLAALQDKAGNKRLAELRKALLSKEHKMRALREALVKLKQEFVQSEIDREAAAIANDRERARKAEDRTAGVDDKLKRLREQVSTLQEGVSQAARDIERERRGRESAVRAKEKLLDDNAQLRAEMSKIEERAASLEDRLTATRRDLDAAREKEERLRNRVKTLGASSSNGKASGDGKDTGNGGGGGRKKAGRSASGTASAESKASSSSSDNDGYGDKGDHDYDDDDSYSTPGADGGGSCGRGGGAGGGGGGKRRRLNELEKRVQVLTAQNAALRTIVPPPTPPTIAKNTAVATTTNTSTASMMKGQGRRLGTAADSDASPSPGAGAGAVVSTPTPGGAVAIAGGNAPSGGVGIGAGVGSHREAAHRAWEAEKKLRRRVEALERRLEERGAELQAAEGQVAKAKDLLARANKEKEAALRRLKDGGQDQNGGARAAAGSSPDTTEEMRSQLFQLEEENASLKRAAELELPREVESLKHQVRTLRAQLEETDNQLEEAERRAKVVVARALNGDGPGGGGGILRAEEGLFHELQAARDELLALKAIRRHLEGQVVERDSVNMELRFDLEAKAVEAERLRRRVRELQASLRSQGGSPAGVGGGGKEATLARPAGGRFKRERDLEGVVEALKRVTDKLRGENHRLRRMTGEGGGRAEAERSAREAKKKAAALRLEVERLTGRAKDAETAVQKLAQKQELVNQLRRKLKARDEDLKSFQERVKDLAETKTLLSAELEAANQRLTASDRESRASSRTRASTTTAAAAAAHAAKELEDARRAAATLRQQVQHQSETIDRLREDARDRGDARDRDAGAEDAAAAGVSDSVKAAEAAAVAAQDEADDLRDRLAEAERELQRMERRSAMSAARGGGSVAASDGGDLLGTSEARLAKSDGVVRERGLELERENRRLKEENDKLSTELQAFDLEFFEEIEDLKYKYSEATKKLRQYEE
eukprot:g18493.t1